MKKTKTKLKKIVSEKDEFNAPTQQINSFQTTSFLETWSIPLIGILVISVLLIGYHSEAVNHPWDKGDQYCDSSSRIEDPILKNQILEEGGGILRSQLAMHPYHARLWAMYGHYYIQKKNWDSCIAVEKKALELGYGTHINSIVDMSLMYLNYALNQKLIPTYRYKDSALNMINQAESPYVKNISLDKFRGITYFNANDYVNANQYLLKFVPLNKKDFDGAFFLAWTQINLGQKSEAIKSFELAKMIDPNNVNLNNLALRINQQ